MCYANIKLLIQYTGQMRIIMPPCVTDIRFQLLTLVLQNRNDHLMVVDKYLFH